MVLKEVTVQTITAATDSPLNSHTLYLFCKDNKYVLPIGIDSTGAQAVRYAQKKVVTPRPHVHDTTKRLILSLGAVVKEVLIYKHVKGTFYAYIRLEKKGEILDIDAKLTDAVAISLRMGKRILIPLKMLYDVGIQITREILDADSM